MSRMSENIRKSLQRRIEDSEVTLDSTREWIEKLKSAGFSVSDLETRQLAAEDELERLRMLL